MSGAMDTVPHERTSSVRHRVALLLARHQAQQRVPLLSVAVSLPEGALIDDAALRWVVPGTTASGSAVDPAVQLRIGSVTKTVTAALVLAARDAGLLDLDDRAADVLDRPLPTQLRIADLLAHRSGARREPLGEVWSTARPVSREQLLSDPAHSAPVSAVGRRFHYSNVAFGVLGEVAARVFGAPWPQLVAQRIAAPLGLRRLSVTPSAPVSPGYFPDPYSDAVVTEIDLDDGALGAAGGLWSDAADVARWTRVLVQGHPGVLAADTAAEMAEVRAMADPVGWRLGYGLGVMLLRRDDAVWVGHTGGMPGFQCAAFADPATGVAVAVLTATGRGGDATAVAGEVLDCVLAADPLPVTPWRPGPPVPPPAADLLGPWWTEGVPVELSWRAGQLEARVVGAPASRPPAVFAAAGTDRWTTVSGREAGEELVVVRGPDGGVTHLTWATYWLTRDPASFAATAARAARAAPPPG